MEVTSDMLVAAVKQAVEDKIIPNNEVDTDTYLHYYASVKRDA